MTERPVLDLSSLHQSLTSPVSESMNLLNEVALRYPQAISFAAGRPYEGFFDLDSVHRCFETYRAYLVERLGDEAAVRRELLQYGRTKGIIHELIARHLKTDERIEADAESIVVTVGCQEALYLVLRALRRDESDTLLAVAPTYVGLHGAAQLADLRVLTVSDTEGGVDLDDLERVTRRARARGLRPRACYLVPDFANPSGQSLSLPLRRRLLQRAAELDLLLLEDNPYGLLGTQHLPTLKSQDEDGRVVYLGTFAKTGLPGARIGYAVADQRVGGAGAAGLGGLLADELAKIKSMLTVNTPPIAQAVIGGLLLENGCSLITANAGVREVYWRNTEHLRRGLVERFPYGRAPSVQWNQPAGGFFSVLSVPFAAGDELLGVSAAKYGVLWTPMHHFYAQEEPCRQIRLSVSHLTAEQIDEGLDRLADFIQDQSSACPAPPPTNVLVAKKGRS
jgi:(S)-3,5-dihydroxyphenylglycine transaminase